MILNNDQYNDLEGTVTSLQVILRRGKDKKNLPVVCARASVPRGCCPASLIYYFNLASLCVLFSNGWRSPAYLQAPAAQIDPAPPAKHTSADTVYAYLLRSVFQA